MAAGIQRLADGLARSISDPGRFNDHLGACCGGEDEAAAGFG